MRKSFLQVVLLLILLSVAGMVTQAQDMGTIRRSYFMAADADGVQQVYHLLLDNGSEVRQLTDSDTDVVSFGVSYDGLSIAYIRDGQLWLQSIHTEEAQALAPITSGQHVSSPVYSPDNQYIAYADNGVWLLDLGSRETQQILQNVPLTQNASNANEFRIYQPERFVLGVDGSAGQLVVDIGKWEWNTAGIYDLDSGRLQEMEGQLHTDLLPLYGGRALLFGNNGVSGEPALHVADSLDDINSLTEVISFAELTNDTLFVEQAVEIAPGTIRVLGTGIGPAIYGGFYFDYDLMSQESGEVHYFYLMGNAEIATVFGDLSPDGSILPIYQIAMWPEDGSIRGDLVLGELITGNEMHAFAEPVGPFHWQP